MTSTSSDAQGAVEAIAPCVLYAPLTLWNPAPPCCVKILRHDCACSADPTNARGLTVLACADERGQQLGVARRAEHVAVHQLPAGLLSRIPLKGLHIVFVACVSA